MTFSRTYIPLTQKKISREDEGKGKVPVLK